MNDSLRAIIDIIDDAVMHDALSTDDLRVLNDHLNERAKEARRQEGRALAATLAAGSKVRISETANLRPRYIIGTEAVVVKVNQTTATITLGEVRLPPGTAKARFYTGQTIRCPLDALELIEGL